MAQSDSLVFDLLDVNQAQKEVTANAALVMLEQVVAKKLSKAMSGSDITLTIAESNYMAIEVSGTGGNSIIVPAKVRQWIIDNKASSSIVVKTVGGVGVTVVNGTRKRVYCDSTECYFLD